MNDTPNRTHRTDLLRDLGQSLWLDNISRGMLDDGTLGRYIADYGITGLTSNPTIFEKAIGDTGAYDAGIRDKAAAYPARTYSLKGSSAALAKLVSACE